MGGPYDYMVVDPVSSPRRYRDDVIEKVVTLPHSYFPTQHRHRFVAVAHATAGLHQAVWMARWAGTDTEKGGGVAAARLAAVRRRFQLPTHLFLFASFNAYNKLGPHSLSAWVLILRRVPHSCLVLLDTQARLNKTHPVACAGDDAVCWADGDITKQHIYTFALEQGVTPSRFLFLPRLPLDAHLERLAAMDLCLDTFPYNAHTTGADALWAGLPVLTWPQRRFSGRVAASQLHASMCLSRVGGLSPTRMAADLDSWTGGDSNEQMVYTAFSERMRKWTHRPTATLEDPSAMRAFVDAVFADRAEGVFSWSIPEGVSAPESGQFGLFPYLRPVAMRLPPHVVDFRRVVSAPHGRLTVASRAHYVDMAVFFAYNSDALLTWRSCLEQERWRAPLFDAVQFTRHLETAYTRMWDRWQSGAPPIDIDVPWAPVTTTAERSASVASVFSSRVALSSSTPSSQCFSNATAAGAALQTHLPSHLTDRVGRRHLATWQWLVAVCVLEPDSGMLAATVHTTVGIAWQKVWGHQEGPDVVAVLGFNGEAPPPDFVWSMHVEEIFHVVCDDV
jgi:hypothetical protein